MYSIVDRTGSTFPCTSFVFKARFLSVRDFLGLTISLDLHLVPCHMADRITSIVFDASSLSLALCFDGNTAPDTGYDNHESVHFRKQSG